MDTSSVLATSALVLSVGGSIIAVINHKRIRSSCCGKKIDVSLDIENTTPPKIHPAPTIKIETAP